MFIDDETGECLEELTLDQEDEIFDLTNDAETGEPRVSDIEILRGRKVPFQIPRAAQEKPAHQSKSGLLRRKRKRPLMEPVPVGACFGQTNPIFLFLPAIIYSRWFLALLMVFEAAFHMWAHHKNKRLRNSSVYFRSPFHSISSEFCALCQNETCMDRVGKIQQARMNRFLLKHCNYVKRVV